MMAQIDCLNAKDARAWRWDAHIILFLQSLRFTGGALAVETLRGKALEKLGSHGHLWVTAPSFNLFLPSLSTIKSHLPYIDPWKSCGRKEVRFRI